MKSSRPKHQYTVMFLTMVLSGLLSTMSAWVDKINDIRFTINDIYMNLLMSGWMFVITGIFYHQMDILFIGVPMVIITMWCIRTQFLVTETQYKSAMIQHNSIAVHMSKKLLEKDNNITPLLQKIIKNQENELAILKM
jgi:hypothetical protein